MRGRPCASVVGPGRQGGACEQACLRAAACPLMPRDGPAPCLHPGLPADIGPPPPPNTHTCSEYSRSMVVTTQAPKELGTLRAADGAEGLQDKGGAQ